MTYDEKAARARAIFKSKRSMCPHLNDQEWQTLEDECFALWERAMKPRETNSGTAEKR